jgi:hypothetical protein
MVVRLIQAGDFTAYPDALRFIIAVKDAGIKVAAASSSKNTVQRPDHDDLGVVREEEALYPVITGMTSPNGPPLSIRASARAVW